MRISGSKNNKNNTGTHYSQRNITRDKISFKKSDKLKFENEEAGEVRLLNGYRIGELTPNVI